MIDHLEKLCPEFLQTPNAAGIIAFLFNQCMTLENRCAVPDAVAKEIGRYMQDKGYSMAFNRFYKEREEIDDKENRAALEALQEFAEAWRACCGLPDTSSSLERLDRICEKAEQFLAEIKAAKAAKESA